MLRWTHSPPVDRLFGHKELTTGILASHFHVDEISTGQLYDIIEAGRDSRAEQKFQSRSEKSFQWSGDRRRDQARSLRGVLCGIGGQGHAAGNGAADPGQEDCHHRPDRVEERSVLRRPTSETTNSLSVSARVRSILGIFSGGGRCVLETLWFESESQLIS